MRRQILLGGLILTASILGAERVALGQAQGEIVVPTFNLFTISTTVSVPDRGGMLMGGSDSASNTRTEYGPGFGRGLASRSSASDAVARVWIHDFQEMEQSLGKGLARDDTPPPTGFAARMHQYASSRAKEEKPKDEPERRNSSLASTDSRKNDSPKADLSKADQAANLLKRGQDAEARGKIKVASLYYKSVVSLGSTPSARSAQERLNSLDTKLAGR